MGAFAAVGLVAAVFAAAPASVGAHGAATVAKPIRLAASTAAATTYPLPADCRPSPIAPPYELGTIIQVGHPAGLDAAIPDGTLTAGPVAVTGISASLCGVVTVVAGSGSCPVTQTITIPADGQHFAGLKAVLSVNPAQPATVPFKVTPRTITASLPCASSAQGLQVATTGTMAALEGSTGLFGIDCVIGPADADLKGIVNSPTQSFGDFEGTLSGSIGLPSATVAHACPSEIASNLNTLAGLPRSGQLTLPTKVALYQAGHRPVSAARSAQRAPPAGRLPPTAAPRPTTINHESWNQQMNATKHTGIRKLAVVASAAGMAAVGLAAPSAFASTSAAHITPANTTVKGTSSKASFTGTVDGFALSVNCLAVSATGKTPANGLTATLAKAPSFTKCTDSLGGTDTVVTTGTWKLVANSTGSMLTFDLPVKAATFTSTLLSGCKIQVTPTKAGTITGKYNNISTWTITKSAFAIAGTGCSTSATATATSTVKFTPGFKVVS